jgi:hypothetical protein
MIDNDKPEKDIRDKVSEWLSNEGYPLEFFSAGTFHSNGFYVRQRYYVQDLHSDSPREIDVLAEITSFSPEPSFLRICYVVECKWSGDKPWAVFTSRHHQIAESACIAQTIGSEVGEAILWSLAGDKAFHSLNTFSTPETPGFNGRQVFSKSNDVFYSAMQSVASAANSLAKEYNRSNRSLQDTLHAAVIIFPVIVLDGLLYKVSFNETNGQIELESADQIRIHWRGAETSKFPFTTIDIVTSDKLDAFAKQRGEEAHFMLQHMTKTLEIFQECVKQNSLAPLSIQRAPRGMVGLPPFLAKIRASEQEEKSSSRKRISSSDEPQP